MPPSILELNDNLTTLVDTSKLISIINRLIKKKWFFLSGGSPEEKAGNLNHEQAALRVLSINSIYCPQKNHEKFLEQWRKPRNIVLINSVNFLEQQRNH